ncbi:4-alpha-glucanotransferase [Hibiscus syriacus]|uniref:4-alpha-glucanotransferase n=1 Tax=Hibiscus syriacus TaxID=106335 RepID=A0A6A3A9G8_HIBSY|nr:4-alpha-glucanotransferase [Hibiscus syriacus]
MEESSPSTYESRPSTTTSSKAQSNSILRTQPISLVQPSQNNKKDKPKVVLAFRSANPTCLPWLVVELALETNVLQKELSGGIVRIVLECEKKAEKEKMTLFEEPLWTMYCNGRKTGYCVKREATEEDLDVMELHKSQDCFNGGWGVDREHRSRRSGRGVSLHEGLLRTSYRIEGFADVLHGES